MRLHPFVAIDADQGRHGRADRRLQALTLLKGAGLNLRFPPEHALPRHSRIRSDGPHQRRLTDARDALQAQYPQGIRRRMETRRQFSLRLAPDQRPGDPCFELHIPCDLVRRGERLLNMTRAAPEHRGMGLWRSSLSSTNHHPCHREQVWAATDKRTFTGIK
ncbi:MAG TPA: hypothetical protein QF361_03840 [Gammaproteobacteria bacterium]|nr:hypothetical protein [Gammaproteobacteria bacterium]